MGQAYQLVNLLKRKVISGICGKATEILLPPSCIHTGDFQDLILLLLNLDHGDMSLKNSCLKTISKDSEHYQLDLLLKRLAQEVKTTITADGDLASLLQCGIGQWAGDRIALIADEGDSAIDDVTYEMARDFPSSEINVTPPHLKMLETLCSEMDYKIQCS